MKIQGKGMKAISEDKGTEERANERMKRPRVAGSGVNERRYEGKERTNEGRNKQFNEQKKIMIQQLENRE